MDLGYDCRVVFGQHGRYGIGHPWVEFFADANCYLLEPQLSTLGLSLPRLTTLPYRPRISLAWDRKSFSTTSTRI
jgi:hypothetical protein